MSASSAPKDLRTIVAESASTQFYAYLLHWFETILPLQPDNEERKAWASANYQTLSEFLTGHRAKTAVAAAAAVPAAVPVAAVANAVAVVATVAPGVAVVAPVVAGTAPAAVAPAVVAPVVPAVTGTTPAVVAGAPVTPAVVASAVVAPAAESKKATIKKIAKITGKMKRVLFEMYRGVLIDSVTLINKLKGADRTDAAITVEEFTKASSEIPVSWLHYAESVKSAMAADTFYGPGNEYSLYTQTGVREARKMEFIDTLSNYIGNLICYAWKALAKQCVHYMFVTDLVLSDTAFLTVVRLLNNGDVKRIYDLAHFDKWRYELPLEIFAPKAKPGSRSSSSSRSKTSVGEQVAPGDAQKIITPAPAAVPVAATPAVVPAV